MTETATATETSLLNMNSSFVKLNRVNSNSLKMSNVGEFGYDLFGYDLLGTVLMLRKRKTNLSSIV